MGMAPVTHVLFTRSVYRRCAWALRSSDGLDRFFNANPKSSKWLNRDRFVLSNGYVLVFISHSE